jgi:hypothetical protein
MGWFVKFIFVLGVILAAILFTVDFSNNPNSNTIEAVLISVIGGIFVFVLFIFISGLSYINLKKKAQKDTTLIEKIKRRKKRNYAIGFILMIFSMILFLNSYLYIKALMGNDMLVSLKIDNENFVIKNGEEGEQLNVNARILTNPFCEANCSLSLEDLSEDRIVYSENMNIQFSSPIIKDYLISSNNEKFGQKLYKVKFECNTLKSRFCYTAANTTKSRIKIVSVDYRLNDLQKSRKDELKSEIESLNNEFYKTQNGLNNLSLDFSFLDLSEFENESFLLKEYSNPLLIEINNLNTLYENQEYPTLWANVFNIKENVTSFENRFNKLNSSVFYDKSTYNSLVNNMSSMYAEILYLEDYSFSNSSILQAKLFIENFNSALLTLNEDKNIDSKILLFNNLELEKENLFSILANESSSEIVGENTLNISIHSVNLPKILMEEEIYNESFVLNEPSPICCFKNECYKCISNSSSNYPVILVHGHSFNEKLSAELSMEAFGEMANQLEIDGYLDAGYFYGNQYEEEVQGDLGKINKSIVVEATYYLDTSTTEEGSFIFDSKWESIDTYAERLNEIVSNVKYLTGKDKVIIVGHSMGCLVTRRYIQLYGGDSLDKVILVGGPNNGIDGLILTSCPVFGSDIECNEMDKNSLFISELTSAPIPDIPVYNIIGLGCPLEGSNSDGIVKSESAYLDWAENFYVSGTCTGVDFFHVRMIKPTKHPEIYTLIKGFIEE